MRFTVLVAGSRTCSLWQAKKIYGVAAVWMLNYNGEAHGLRQEQNREDWAIRMQQFFDHYLQDAPIPVWMDEGVPAILKGKTHGLGLTNKRVISDEGTGRG